MPAHERAERSGPAPAQASRRNPSLSRPPAFARVATTAVRQGSSHDEVLALQRTVGNGAVSRLLGADEPVHDETPVQRSGVEEVLSGPGTPLAAPVRAEMEARLGADFSGVRLHTGPAARDSAAEIGARAYTSGDHVVIGDGGADKHTLAHELTHVIQQRQGPVAGTDNGSGLRISDPSDRFEREAEANAHRVMTAQLPKDAAGPSSAPSSEPDGAHADGTRAEEQSHAASADRPLQRAALGVLHKGPEDSDRRELDSGDEEQVRDYVFTTLGKGNHEAAAHVLSRLRELSPQPAYLDNLQQAVDGLSADPGERPKIPAQVHFIWIGGDIPVEALDNVIKWASKASNTGWTINLWSDSRTRLSVSSSMRIRLTSKLRRRSIEEAIDPRLADAYREATTGKRKAYPFASDLARYSILKKHGGVYADVDLGAGTVILDERNTPRLREKDLPVLGPLIRDNRSLGSVLGQAGASTTETPGPEQIRAAVTHLLDTGGYGNHFIAAQQNSAVMDRTIAEIEKKIKGMGSEELHMAGPAASGPFMLMRVIEDYLKEEFGITNRRTGEYARFHDQGNHFHDNMEWLTPESENQNY